MTTDTRDPVAALADVAMLDSVLRDCRTVLASQGRYGLVGRIDHQRQKIAAAYATLDASHAVNDVPGPSDTENPNTPEPGDQV